MSRNATIDVLKGYAILLVILGHSIQRTDTDWQHNILMQIIYSFHMPLFMMISGYLSYDKMIDRRWITRRFTLLMVPFIAWYIVYFFFSPLYLAPNFLVYLKEGVKYPNNGLWYLWVLFENCLVLYGIKLVTRYFKVNEDILLVLSIVMVNLMPTDLFGLLFFKGYIIFFVFGYWTAKYQYLFRDTKYYYLYILSFLYPAVFVFAHNQENFNIVPKLSYFMTIPGFAGYKFAIAIMGCSLSFLLIEQLEKIGILKRLLENVGIVSLDIYATHIPFLSFGISAGFIRTASTFFIALSAALLVSYLLRYNKYLSFIFLGRYCGPKINSALINSA